MNVSKPLLPGARPLFLIGCPRSGTTFTANLLNSHPEVLMTSETAVFILADDIIKKAREGVASGINYGKQYHGLLSDMLARNYRSLIEAYYERIADEQQRQYLSYWGEKHPHMHECIDRVEAEFPGARYVYIVRDPRDSACSIADMIGVDYVSAINNWKVFADAYEAFVATLAPNRVLTLRYEDIVDDYYAAATTVFKWLELPIAAQVLDFIHAAKDIDAHTTRTKKNFVAKSIGRWKGRLGSNDIDLTNALVGDYLDKYGYGAA